MRRLSMAFPPSFPSQNYGGPTAPQYISHTQQLTVNVEDENGDTKEVRVEADEGIRAGTTVEKLGKLKSAFGEGGSTTAGNSSQVRR